MKNKETESTIADIARAAGVSTATVSRVFSRHPYVSDPVRENVLELAKKLNYAPHISSSRYIFGLLYESGGGYSFGAYANQIYFHISKSLFARGFNVQIFSTEQLPYVHKNTFRGVILNSASSAELFRKRGIPAVLVNSSADGFRSVMTDHRESLEIAVRHLAAKGHRRIAFLRCGANTWGSSQRELGYRSAMAECGLPVEEGFIAGYADPERDIPLLVGNLLARKPTALIAEGEDNCPIVGSALWKAGVRIPDDLSFIGFENAAFSRFMNPPCTTVCQNFAELGEAAAETVIRISGPHAQDFPSGLTVLHNTLIERESVKAL